MEHSCKSVSIKNNEIICKITLITLHKSAFAILSKLLKLSELREHILTFSKIE